jgi:hypothetical protein
LHVWYFPVNPVDDGYDFGHNTVGPSPSNGNPGTFMKTGLWGANVFATLPASPDQAETWRISFDWRIKQAYSASTFRVYGFHTHDLLNGSGATGFGDGTVLYQNTSLPISSSWSAVSQSVLIPGGYDIVICNWYTNTGDTAAGIDNFAVERTAVGITPAIAGPARTVRASVAGGLIRVAVPRAGTRIVVDIYDLRGVRVAGMGGGIYAAGTYAFKPMAGNNRLGAGRYVVRIGINGTTQDLPILLTH